MSEPHSIASHPLALKVFDVLDNTLIQIERVHLLTAFNAFSEIGQAQPPYFTEYNPNETNRTLPYDC